MVPGTSSNWPYHKNLLVFYLKVGLAHVCEYLSYYYNITNYYWTIPEKIQAGGFEDILVLKTILTFSNLWTKQSFTLTNSVKLCYTSWKFQDQPKMKTYGNSAWYFLNIHENSMPYIYIYIVFINVYIYIILIL